MFPQLSRVRAPVFETRFGVKRDDFPSEPARIALTGLEPGDRAGIEPHLPAASHRLAPIKRRIILHASGFAGDLPAAAAAPE